ncbi:diguanylate cyclase [Methylonatrum kenyense]|uniref:sensor domain-containing diguanylate cyclase n=1 Tax=Methylonatrum kenyense TaxID=455253 RepID=UPI0020C0C3EC|nr:diguanylate cyclase [Methylonatrum kenyense]MCK8516354.1 diguanylate cyclase [Methylonatrum kenyense]
MGTGRDSLEARFQRQQRALLQISRLWCEFGDGVGARDAMREVARIAVQSLLVQRASIWFPCPEGGSMLDCAAQWDADERLRPLPSVILLDDFPAYSRALARQGVLVDLPAAGWPGAVGPRLVVPICCGAQRDGVLCLETENAERRFLPDEFNTARHLANMLGAVLEAQRRRDAARKVEEELRDEIVRWNNLLDQSWDGIVILDESGAVYQANRRYAEMLGYTQDEMQRLHVWDWDENYTREELKAMLAAVDEVGAHFETRQRRRDGTVIDIELGNNGLYFKDRKLIFCICRDITARKRTEARIHRLATTDALTRLANRNEFSRVLDLELQRSRRHGNALSLIMYDLDHFKAINDRFGHAAGDRVLRTVSEVVRSTVRQTDLVGRWGGEEFLVLLPQTPLADAVALAEKLRLAVAALRISEVGDVTASFGVTAYKHAEHRDDLFRRVDEAMYRAKENGRNRVESV